MANDEERSQAEVKGRLPDGHEEYSYNGETESLLLPPEQESENVAAAQRAMEDLAARALSGELSINTMRTCRRFFTQLLDGMAVPETTDDMPMEDM
jgi:hypothetical protein